MKLTDDYAKTEENGIGVQGASSFEIREGCVGCNACVRICRVKAMSIEHGQPVIDQAKCVNCCRCAAICPGALIKMRE